MIDSSIDLALRFDRATATSRRNAYRIDPELVAYRSFSLAAILLSALEATAAAGIRTYWRYRRWQRANAAYEALRGLDDHTLRDLGFDRSEARSVAAEFVDEADDARLRVLTNHPW